MLFSFYTGILISSFGYFVVYCIFKKNDPLVFPKSLLPALFSGIYLCILLFLCDRLNCSFLRCFMGYSDCLLLSLDECLKPVDFLSDFECWTADILGFVECSFLPRDQRLQESNFCSYWHFTCYYRICFNWSFLLIQLIVLFE